MRPYDRSHRDSPFIRKRQQISRLKNRHEEQHSSWIDRPSPGSQLAENLRDVGELLAHIQQMQTEGSLAHSSNLFKGYLTRASRELADLCKLITERMRGAQDMEILEATASLVSELALAENDDASMEALASTLNEIQPTGVAVAAALATAKDLEVIADRSTLGYDAGKLVTNVDMDIAVAFDNQPPIGFTIRTSNKIDFDSIRLSDSSKPGQAT